jgi:hypothetical protein
MGGSWIKPARSSPRAATSSTKRTATSSRTSRRRSRLILGSRGGSSASWSRSGELRYIGGTNAEISDPARTKLDFLTESDAWKKGDAAAHRDLLQKFLKDQPGTRDIVADTPEGFVGRRDEAKYVKPEEVANFGFKSGRADALKYTVKVGDQNVTVYAPKKPDAKNGHFHDIDQVAKSLGALPPEVRERIRSINIEPGKNPEDEYWAKAFKNPEFRAYASASPEGSVWLYPAKGERPQRFLDSSLIHETGHILSEQLWGPWQKEGGGWKGWKAAGEKDGLVPSKYARSSLGEDFSETLAVYQRVRGTPREAELRGMMPERFAILDKLMKK